MPTSGHFVTMGFQIIGNIDILHVRLYIRLQNFNFHPDRFSSNGAPTAIKSRPTNTSQNQSINLLMHSLGGHDAKLTVYLYIYIYIYIYSFPIGRFANLVLCEYYNLLYAEQNPEIVSTIYKWSRGLSACSPLGIVILNKRWNTLFILSKLYRW